MPPTDAHTDTDADLPALMDGLLDPAAYPHAASGVTVLQTHISYVLLAGDFAYKIKKPVDLGFLDYTTLERRRRMCEEEVRLNRRLCDDVYLGVSGIARRPDGRYEVDGDGEPVEYAVRMRRVSEDRTMPRRLAAGTVSQRDLAAIASKLSTFHVHAETNPVIAAWGRPEAVRRNWDENLQQAFADRGRTITTERARAIAAFGDGFFASRSALFNERADAGCVRDGHGDLRSDAVVLNDDGSVCFMDCIEFNDRLRYADVASDVAFLAMDLEFRGYRRHADEFVSLYLERDPDPTFSVMLPFYRIYRACVRGKVDGMLAAEPEVPPEQRHAAADRAARYWQLAERLAASIPPQSLIVMMGLSGSGKSFIARALAARIGAVLLSSDVIRRDAAAVGGVRHPHAGPSYTRQARDTVYDGLLAAATVRLARGLSVVLDATFIKARNRSAALHVAALADVPVLVVEVSAAPDVVRARMDARDASGSLSDARWGTYLKQQVDMEAPAEIAPAQLCRLDGALSVEESVERALAALSRAMESRNSSVGHSGS